MHRLRLTAALTEDLDDVWLDRRKVKQILHNLLSDAVKFRVVGVGYGTGVWLNCTEGTVALHSEPGKDSTFAVWRLPAPSPPNPHSN
ncbi:MAG: hypothetical protein H6974_05170 [Gammaproteobacteria bacterium]|nr:hypothetical protein [Gammaproteobacteria bacterium]MCP5196171.1 hypothetical protein [Gammaproteobacteria bacterium]